MNITFIDLPSPNFEPRVAVDNTLCIRHLILHYTGMRSRDDALDRLCDKASHVSAHYLIDEDGQIYRMVEEDKRAWHAGVSYWRGERDINTTSIGIELVNPGHEHGYRPFPYAQINALIPLAQDIVKRHQIRPDHVLGHSDVAPGRKTDPGELFPWKAMSDHGIGDWPLELDSPSPNLDPENALTNLSRIGYATPLSAELGSDILNPETAKNDVISAFQRRYRQSKVDGILDGETAGLIAAISDSPHSA